MLKKILPFALIFTIIVAIAGFAIYNGLSLRHENEERIALHEAKQAGLTLDISRKYYSTGTIKDFIDDMSGIPHAFVQLYMSDDHALGVELETVGQTEEQAEIRDGIAYNPDTNLPFLTKNELRDLVDYAIEHRVLLIPELGTPSRMGAVLERLEAHSPQKREVVRLAESDPRSLYMMDPAKPASLELAKAMIGEYLPIFAQQAEKYFHIGGGEAQTTPQSSHPDLVNYVNQLNDFLKKRGFTMRMWNDSIGNGDVTHLDKDIQIAYWTPNSRVNFFSQVPAASLGFEHIAPAQQLLNKGFKLLNYNAYYLYLLPSEETLKEDNLAYSIESLKNHWTLAHLTLNSGIKVSSIDSVIGSSISIWSENVGQLTDKEVQQGIHPFVGAYLESAKGRVRPKE
ncbi:family 20 glycosylhydrolase [Lactococcus formosensis]|uniref:family 20 glycosylhydrolase n=1 Tax=Lactococcus formosensis TaxID=1281486 RepID=UPI0022E449AB|nr:family 20 glycosylhydrolase [Lactococcus formosensis]MDT2726902.1 family 20 glycosylhydrolase [Lactococcus formosensis]